MRIAMCTTSIIGTTMRPMIRPASLMRTGTRTRASRTATRTIPTFITGMATVTHRGNDGRKAAQAETPFALNHASMRLQPSLAGPSR